MSIVAAITQRVLIIDDNPAIHNDIRKVFGAREGHGQLDELEQALFGTRADDTPSEEFAIDSAYQGQEGLTKVRKSLERGMHYDVAIVDMRMPPGWDGVETIRHIWDVDPDIQVVICTALSDYTWEEVTECLSYSDRLLIVKKPFEPCELLQAVRALSEKRRLLARSYDQLEKVNQVVEQRTAELSEAHREASLLLSAISSVLIWLDDRGRVTRWNDAAAALFDLPRLKVVGRVFDNLPIAWDSREGLNALKPDIQYHAPEHVELAFTRPGGERRTLSCTVCPICDAGEYCGVLILGADVTRQRLLEQQLNQAQKLESIGQLAAGVAHEINTPMQYIGDNIAYLKGTIDRLTPLLDAIRNHNPGENSAEQLEDSVCGVQATRMLDRILDGLPSVFADLDDGIGHVTQIVKAMKEFAHPGSDETRPIDINRAIESTIVVAKNEWKYVSDVKLQLGDDMPPVDGHAHELNQVFLNLLINAAHAIGSVTPEGEKGLIQITTRKDGDGCLITIRDTGGGIPSEIQNKVFDPFFTTKEVGKGTGQGLAIAHRVIVQQLGGRLWFHSSPGEGTEFFIWLRTMQ